MKNLIISMTILILFCGCTKNNIKLHFLDIAKADCIIIKTKTKNIMIDTGLDSSSSYILNKIRAYKIKQIDVLILTHFDIDHIGGADKIIKSIPVKKIYMPNYSEVNDEYFELINAITTNNIPYTIVNEPISFAFDSIIYDLYPSKTNQYTDEEDNNISLITKITNKQISFLLAGDIEEERIIETLDENYLSSTLVKIPHHGSDNPHNFEWLQKVNAKWAIITSNNNKKQINQYLQSLNTNILYTRNGDITCQSNGKNLKCTQN